MPCHRQQLDIAILAAAFVLLAGLCGLTVGKLIYGQVTFVRMWLRMAIDGTVVGVLLSEVALLACWAALRRNAAISWGGVLLTLTFICYAFVLGARSEKTEYSARLTEMTIGFGAMFFVVYAYMMPLAAFWQWRLENHTDESWPRNERRLNLRQMLVWTFAVTLPFAVWQLFVPDQRDGTAILGSIGLAEIRTYVLPNLMMLGTINVTCFLISMFSSLWLRRCGYGFVVAHGPSESSRPSPVN